MIQNKAGNERQRTNGELTHPRPTTSNSNTSETSTLTKRQRRPSRAAKSRKDPAGHSLGAAVPEPGVASVGRPWRTRSPAPDGCGERRESPREAAARSAHPAAPGGRGEDPGLRATPQRRHPRQRRQQAAATQPSGDGETSETRQARTVEGPSDACHAAGEPQRRSAERGNPGERTDTRQRRP